MKQPKLHIGLLIAALLSVTVLATAPVSARQGSDDNEQAVAVTDTDDGTADQGSGDASDTSTETETETSDDSTARVGRLKGEARRELAKLREGKTEKSQAKLQKVCENRQNAVNHKVTAFGNAAQKHLERLDSVFTKLQAFQADKNLSVDNYQALVDDATAKQAAATSAVAALKTVAVDIDCTSTDPASSLTVVKTAAKEARDALKAYRKALKEIVVAFAQANKTDDASAEGDQ
jgi:hypothetical protein